MEPEYAEEFEDMETNTEPLLADDGLSIFNFWINREFLRKFDEPHKRNVRAVIFSTFKLLSQSAPSKMARIHFDIVGHQALIPKQFLTLALMGA